MYSDWIFIKFIGMFEVAVYLFGEIYVLYSSKRQHSVGRKVSWCTWRAWMVKIHTFLHISLKMELQGLVPSKAATKDEASHCTERGWYISYIIFSGICIYESLSEEILPVLKCLSYYSHDPLSICQHGFLSMVKARLYQRTTLVSSYHNLLKLLMQDSQDQPAVVESATFSYSPPLCHRARAPECPCSLCKTLLAIFLPLR